MTDIFQRKAVEDSNWSYDDAYNNAHKYVRFSGKASLDSGWKDAEDYFGINRNNFQLESPIKLKNMINLSKSGKGWLVERGKSFEASQNGNLGIYRIYSAVFENAFSFYTWAFVMGVETSAIIYCRKENGKDVFGYVPDSGKLPKYQAIAGKAKSELTYRIAGTVDDATVASMIADIPKDGIPIHLAHSHLVDRIDINNTSNPSKPHFTSVGQVLGLSDGDIGYFVGPRFKGKIGISAVEDNGKTHSIKRGSGGKMIWEDL